MSIWEMKDMELACNMEFLPFYLVKGRLRRLSQMCPSLAQRNVGRDMAKAFVKLKEGQMAKGTELLRHIWPTPILERIRKAEE